MRTFTMSSSTYEEMQNEGGGFCLACGEEAWGVEPDACEYTCEDCEAEQVYGIEELALMGCIEFTD